MNEGKGVSQTMSEEKKQEMVTIHVDGEPAEVPAGSNLVDAVELAGKEIPHYCYHPKLSVSGNCQRVPPLAMMRFLMLAAAVVEVL